MSVYKHDYRTYTGKVTPLWTRVLVLARYGLAEIWSSKITVGLFTLSLVPALIFLIGIYLANNPLARLLIMRRNAPALAMNAFFFLKVLEFQSWPALALTSWIAPRLITFDLADNALPILLSHPISRFGYLLGKFLALIASLSLVTWVPCLTLFAYQSYAAQDHWAMNNMTIAAGLLAGSLIWIGFLSLLGLALSSWVKWRAVATGIIFAAILVPGGIGGIVTSILRTKWGLLLNIPVIMTELWQRLLGAPDVIGPRQSLPSTAILGMLALACLVSLAMLNKRIRAREVVRG